MAIINNFPEDSGYSQAVISWFKSVFIICKAVQNSSTTANRPTTDLFIGMPYFDTTLNKPIWLKSVSPNVWIDATGATV
jgi:hypothetical protein